MHSFVKQSTASQSRIIGPFVDDTDFKSLETGLTIANTDIKLSKNGAASVNKNSGGATHIVNGNYAITLDATDTNTVGQLHVSVSVAGALVVVATYTVLEESIYDSLFAASAAGFDANQRISVGAWNGVSLGTTNPLPNAAAGAAGGLPTDSTGKTSFNDIAATAIVSSGAITTSGGAVSTVTTVTNDVGVNEWNGVALSTTNPLPNAGAGAAGGLPTSSAGKTSFNDLSAAQVNAEVVDVLTVDTLTLPGQTAPSNTPTIGQALGWLYKMLRNKKTSTSAQISLYDDAGTTVDAKRTISDDGTTYTEEEIASGP